MNVHRWFFVAWFAMGCSGGDEAIVGAARCQRPSQFPTASACAIVFGTVTSTRGQPLDSIEGNVRASAECRCTTPQLRPDDRGVFSVTLHRLGAPADTATVTLVVLASAPKYPRHVTGAPYFDTLRVTMRFVPIGAAPAPTEVALRIPLP